VGAGRCSTRLRLSASSSRNPSRCYGTVTGLRVKLVIPLPTQAGWQANPEWRSVTARTHPASGRPIGLAAPDQRSSRDPPPLAGAHDRRQRTRRAEIHAWQEVTRADRNARDASQQEEQWYAANNAIAVAEERAAHRTRVGDSGPPAHAAGLRRLGSLVARDHRDAVVACHMVREQQ
jgi:hypothetical protein